MQTERAQKHRLADELAQVAAGQHGNPHHVLGLHERTVRAFRPGAVAMRAIPSEGDPVPMKVVDPGGVFEGELPKEAATDGRYRFEADYSAGDSGGLLTYAYDDPYRAWPTLGELDLHLFNEGRHHQLWRGLGVHRRTHQGVTGTSFAAWGPHARAVRVVGGWDYLGGRLHSMRA